MTEFPKHRIKTLLVYCLLSLTILGCDAEDAPECFRTVGEMIDKEVSVEPFDEIIVYKGIRLFIEQGAAHKVVVETGANLMEEIEVEVTAGRLSLRNTISCNLFREYNVTNVYVTLPNLTWLQNAGNNRIEGRGELHFPEIWLRSYNQEKIDDIYTIGDFELHLVSKSIRITSDNYSHFFLSGSTDNFDVYIADGDGRVQGADLVAQTVEIQHRGTNKITVNPQQVLKGEIRSTGDVISVTRPPIVDIETFYSGKLVFE